MQTATAERIVILEVPADRVEQRLRQTAANNPSTAPARGGAPMSDDERFRELERRIESLEGRIDLLTRILNGNPNR